MARLQDLEIKIRLDASSLETGLRQVERGFKRLNRAGSQLRSFGSLLAPVSLAIGGLGAVSVKSFASFDDAMTQSLAIMGDVSDAMRNDMVKAAEDVSRVTTFSAAEAAEAYFFLASAGLDAKQSIEALPVVAKFAQAGNFDLARATDLLTDAQSALGLTIRDDAVANMLNMAKASDVLVRANTLANATVEQFSVALTSKAGAALKSFNIDIEEGVAVLAAFADQGVKSELAGNALDRILRLLPKAATENAKAFKELGVTVFDEQGNIRNLGLIIGDLERALAGMTDQQKFAALEALGFEARVQSIIKPLLGTSEAIQGYEAELRKAGNTTEKVADKQLGSFTNKMKLVRNRLNLVAKDIGKIVAPVIEDLAEKIEQVVSQFKELGPETKKNIIIALGAVTLLSPVLFGLGTALQAVAGALGLVTTVIRGLTAAFAVSPLLGLAVLLTGIAVAVALFSDETSFSEKVHQRYADALERINDLLKKNKELTGEAREENEKLTQSVIDTTRAEVERELAAARARLAELKLKAEREGQRSGPLGVSGGLIDLQNQIGLVEQEIRGFEMVLNDLHLDEINLGFQKLIVGIGGAGDEARSAAIGIKGLNREFAGLAKTIEIPQEREFTKPVVEAAGVLEELATTAERIADEIGFVFKRAGFAITRAIGDAVAFGGDLLQDLGDIARQVLSQIISGLIRIGLSSLGGPFATIFGGGFAEGGLPPVGKLSLVGEKGPELFVPNTRGRIIPNDELGGGLNINIGTVNADDAVGVRRAVEEGVRVAIEESAKNTGALIRTLQRPRFA